MLRGPVLAVLMLMLAVLRCHAQSVERDKAEALWFLLKHAPENDKKMPVSFFVRTTELAMEARRIFPWAASVPWPIFLNDVLPYAALQEPRDDWRPVFLTHFKESLPQHHQPNSTHVLYNFTTIVEVVEWMNKNAWGFTNPHIKFQPSALPTGLSEYSPFQVLAASHASCTGLANFIVACLRSVGVPARVAGTPHWNLGPKDCPNGDQSPDCGNHDWAEVWSEHGWSFIDPAGDIALNTSWFFPGWTRHQVPDTLNHSIFATSWASTSEIVAVYGGDDDPLADPVAYFPMAWDWTNRNVPAWDVTRRYNVTTRPAVRRPGSLKDDPFFHHRFRH